MDTWALIGGLAVIIGVVAGIVQILDYLQKRRSKRWRTPVEEIVALSLPAPAIPSNLPSQGEFIGREKEKTRVWEALASRWPLTCIDGIGGIGKTALALEVTGECLRASKREVPIDTIPTFDGFIWTTAKDRELTLNDMLDAIARTLDYAGVAQQPLEDKIESVRRLLQSQRCLLIVDNFETISDEAVRDFLLQLPEPSKALITSREQKLRQAWAVSLKGMGQGEALTLIRSEGRRLGLESVEKSEEQVLLRLYKATGGAPLAIKWAVGQIKQKGQSLETVLAALYGAKGNIFEEVFARSWSLLSDEARRILMVVPIFAASTSKTAIEAASDVYNFALDEGLGQLVGMSLVEVTDELDEARRQYSIHPLTRAFGHAKLAENADWEREARARTARYFLEFSKKYAGSKRKSYDKVMAELDNIFAIMEWCKTNERQVFIGLVSELSLMLGSRGYWRQRVEYVEKAIELTRREGDTQLLASFLAVALGWILLKQGKYEDAENHIEEGRVLFEKTGDKRGLGTALRYLGRIARERGDLDRAKKLGEAALRIAREENEKALESGVHSDFGDLAFGQGDYFEAERLYDAARQGFESIGREDRAGTRCVYLGNAILAQRRPEEAEQWYVEGLRIAQKSGRQDNIARARYGLARISEQEDNLEKAAEQAKESLAKFDLLGMQNEADQVRELLERLERKSSAGG